MTDALHPAIRPLAFLLGTWKGAGRGDFPTAHPFEYGEEMRIGHAGKPFLFYEQRTWNPADGTPLHSEAGYFRISDDGTVEFVVAQPTGIAEVLLGPLNGTSFDLHSTGILLTPTAKETLPPWITRLRISRPRVSVPNGCSHLGGCKNARVCSSGS